ncbi:MAG: hypothetical protein BWY06_02925 [Candidatus Latescibacteria bacterium ADurb.Bin168]|nr:MAG: hypothetical protein BWY06_02925 [Candidatus Latescibacteria bacterium ADurb.Bin168]
MKGFFELAGCSIGILLPQKQASVPTPERKQAI